MADILRYVVRFTSRYGCGMALRRRKVGPMRMAMRMNMREDMCIDMCTDMCTDM